MAPEGEGSGRKWSEKEQVEAVGGLTTETYPWDAQLFSEVSSTPNMLGM